MMCTVAAAMLIFYRSDCFQVAGNRAIILLPEGGVSYGYWVCSTLSTMEPQMVLSSDGASLNAVAMKEALQARDCLQKYLMREGKRDACAFNFLGLLYEQEGLLRLAEKAFLSALELLEERESTSSANIAAVRANRGRVLSMLERHSESLSTFASVIEGADLSTQLTLALALYRSNKLKESLQAYERILPSIEKEGHKPLVLTAAAIVAFAQKDYKKCKTLLFEAFQTPPPSLHSLVSLCVFGCWTSDFTLLQAALNETVETIDWQSGTGPLLHPTFSKVLKAMEIILKEKQKGEECMEKLTTLLANTARQGEVPFPLFILHSVKAASNRSQYILVIQKLVHSYPSDIWNKAALMYLLGDNRSLAINYQEVVLLQVQTELNRLSSKEVQTRWDQSQHNALLSLQKWALDAL